MGASRASFLSREKETFVFQNSFSFGLLHISFDCFTTHFNFKKKKKETLYVNVSDGLHDTD